MAPFGGREALSPGDAPTAVIALGPADGMPARPAAAASLAPAPRDGAPDAALRHRPLPSRKRRLAFPLGPAMAPSRDASTTLLPKLRLWTPFTSVMGRTKLPATS
jgi:hypothetical protein